VAFDRFDPESICEKYADSSAFLRQKRGFQRPFLLAAAKPICIHYNKKWKAPSEKFERAHPAYQLPLNFILFKGVLTLPPGYSSIHRHLRASLPPSSDDAAPVAAQKGYTKVTSRLFLFRIRREKAMRGVREVRRSSCYRIYLSLSNAGLCTRTRAVFFAVAVTLRCRAVNLITNNELLRV